MSDIIGDLQRLTKIIRGDSQNCGHYSAMKLAEDSPTSAGEILWCGNCGSIGIQGRWHGVQSEIWTLHRYRIGCVSPIDWITGKEKINAAVDQAIKELTSPLAHKSNPGAVSHEDDHPDE
jgi:hypothetical protein